MKILFWLISIFVLNACGSNPLCPKGSHQYLPIINSSNKNLYIRTNKGHPNWTIIDLSSPTDLKSSTKKPNEKLDLQAGIINPRRTCWEESLALNKLTIYFFDADIIEKVDWKEVQEKGTGLLERREIDLDYLQKNNWEVIYK